MRTIRIAEIVPELPETVVTNEMLHREHPDWNLPLLEAKTGVRARRIAGPGETALDLAERACRRLFEAHPELPGRVGAILFCTQTPDHVMPPNATLLHGRLGLPESVFALDFTLACSGYVYGLALARGLAATGVADEILLVTADTYSRLIGPGDRATRTLFGDGAAVTWLRASERPGLVDLLAGTVGAEADAFTVPAGGCRTPRSAETARPTRDLAGNERSAEQIRMDGRAVLDFTERVVPANVRALLERNGLGIDDLSAVVIHQASAIALDRLEAALGIGADRSFRHLGEIGNTVSASIPLALREAQDRGIVREGGTVLLVGFGVGLSFGSALVTL